MDPQIDHYFQVAAIIAQLGFGAVALRLAFSIDKRVAAHEADKGVHVTSDERQKLGLVAA